MKIFVDTSFLVSLYSPDANSLAAVRAIGEGQHTYVVSSLAEIETINALELRVFRKEISSPEARSSLREFENDLCEGLFQFVRLTDEVFQRAREISRRTTARLGTRTADLLHVATALELEADMLYSFDHQQRKLAQKVRLSVNQ